MEFLFLLGTALFGTTFSSSDGGADAGMSVAPDGEEITGTSNGETLAGTEGDDTILGQGGEDTLLGDFGDDSLSGGADADSIRGGQGDDRIEGGDGDDILQGRQGNDTLTGGSGKDVISGGLGGDVLDGYFDNSDDGAFAASDVEDADDLRAGDGDDSLTLGSADQATGGQGDDSFLTGTWVEAANPPVITDFDAGEDVILVMVPQGAAGDIEVVEDADTSGDALVQFDGQTVARVIGAFGALGADDVVTIESTELI